MTFDIYNIKFDYNSVVIISYLLLSIFAWLLNIITRGWSNRHLFSSYRSSPLNPLTYIRLVTHSIGHADWNHLVHNFLYILLVGPMIEEKYGSVNLLLMLVITSIVIGLYNDIFTDYSILGASGNTYMLIVLSSFSNFSEGKIPITVILIFIFYVIDEFKQKVSKSKDHIYHDGHILGAFCGIAFGVYFLHHSSLLELLNLLK